MDSVDPVSTSPKKVQGSQPFLTKKGLELQKKSDNPSSETEKATTPTPPSPQTPTENSIDVTA